MSRTHQQNDFEVNVEGIGRFVFGSRNMGDEFSIQRKYAERIGGVTPTAWLDTLATWFATLETLTVTAPDGWDINAMDPTDEETYAKIDKVYRAMKEKEDSFRGRKKLATEAERA